MPIEPPSLSSIEGLTDIGLRRGVDMRPTLLRVLTDLYVQKLAHTADEERHYTELAERLLESVDVQTRATVAARLAHHALPPARVIRKLAGDLPEVVAALRSRLPAQMPGPAVAMRIATSGETGRLRESGEAAATGDGIEAELAGELNEMFFAAGVEERRLILLNLDIVAAPTPSRIVVKRHPPAWPRLEAAALARKREDFAAALAHALAISREQARRIARDELGEPIVIAAKALGLPRDVLYRLLLFVNTAVGHSVERVHALAQLYDEIRIGAANDLVAIWQALANRAGSRTTTGLHRPKSAERAVDGRDAASALPHTPIARPQRQRREAS